MGSSISGLHGANDPEEPVGVALELEERPSTPTKQRDAAAAEADVESPRNHEDTPAGKAAILVTQLTAGDSTQPDGAQLAALSALLAAQEGDDMTVHDAVCALLTEQCTVPPTRSTLNALAVFSYLLKHVQQTKTADRYDFADVMLDDPDTLPALRCYVPYDDETPPDDPSDVELFEAALEVMLLCAGQSSSIAVAYESQQKIPVRAGDMVAWSVRESSGRTLDMSISMVFKAEHENGVNEEERREDDEDNKNDTLEQEQVDVVKSKSRCVADMGTYTAWEDGELVFTFDNTFSWLRHKEISMYVYTQDEFDYDDGLDSDDSELFAGPNPELKPRLEPQPEPEQHRQDTGRPTVRVAAGALREAIMRRDLRVCRKIISTPILANLVFEPKRGFVLLHVAAFENAVPFAELLLKAGALVDVRSAQGVTPLFAAAAHGHHAMVKLLVEAGAQTECSQWHATPDGVSTLVKPIDIAAKHGHQQVVEYLQSRGSQLSAPVPPGAAAPTPGLLIGMTVAEAQLQAAAATASLLKPPLPSPDAVTEAERSENSANRQHSNGNDTEHANAGVGGSTHS